MKVWSKSLALDDVQLRLYGINSLLTGQSDAHTPCAMSRPNFGVNEEPDFVLSHVAKGELPNPRAHRAGVKVFNDDTCR